MRLRRESPIRTKLRLMRSPPTPIVEETMNDHDSRDDVGIDSDRTEGSLKQTGGSLKEGAGKLFGDEKMKSEGEADQAEGKLQNTWGSLKDEARDIIGEDEDR
jgi:uncharacterized protein YjbJ (UPF0337 family)